MHNLLTVKETAKYLRIPLPTVYYLVQRGQLPAIQIGGRWRIKKTSLDKDILKEDKSGQPTVLVVDDDESLQNLFKIFLKKIGFSRVVVGTVKEALAALEKQKFDLLFLDLKLPDGPADDVYDSGQGRSNRSCPIVIITGYPDSEMLDRILAKGPVTVLKKPLKVEQLQADRPDSRPQRRGQTRGLTSRNFIGQGADRILRRPPQSIPTQPDHSSSLQMTTVLQWPR